MFKKVLAVMLVLLLLVGFGAWGSVFAQAKFPDVPESYWAYKEINKLVELGILKGYPDGTFKPGNNVTRAEFATMVVLAKKLTLISPATPTFKDVPTNHWAYKQVETAVKAGYLKGYPDGTFGPSRTITREEMAAVMINVKGLNSEAAKITEPVVWGNDWKSISSWAVGAVTVAYRPDVQVLTYRTGVLVAPKNPGTRAECAYAIYRGIISPPVQSDRCIVGQTQEPDALVSFATSMMAQRNIAMQYEDGLIGAWPDGTLFPRISTNVPNLKDGTWVVNSDGTMKTTYYLRKGIKWSDGTPVDYKADIEYAVYEIYLSGKVAQIPTTDPYDKITKIDWPDPYTMVVYWSEPTPFANTGLPIYPSHIYSKIPTEELVASEAVKKPVHLGPYKIKAWVEGAYITLEPNPNWFGWVGSKPLIKEFQYKWYPDTNTLMMNIISGAIDVSLIGLGTVEAENAKKAAKGVTFQYITSTFWEHIDINCDDPILSDIRVRKALILAIDRDEIVRKVHRNARNVSDNIFFLDVALTHPVHKVPSYNPAEAKKLLDEAGWVLQADGYRYKDGKKLTLELSTTTRQDRKDEAVIIQKQLKDIGIDLQLKFLSSTYFFGTYCTHRMFQLALFAWGGDPLEPSGYTIWHSDQIPTEENNWQGQNYTGIRDPELDEAIYTATHVVDPEVRKSAYQKVQARLNALLPAIPLNWFTDIYTIKSNLAMAGFDYTISSSIGYTYNTELWYFEK
ncbi:MAG TPA: ABC transporter substrate-binding protein [Caldisericia bacterium]|nr:ABC transporter substrate-binding protein [Caldisericia bacterium]